jgi:hypothetical protein
VSIKEHAGVCESEFSGFLPKLSIFGIESTPSISLLERIGLARVSEARSLTQSDRLLRVSNGDRSVVSGGEEPSKSTLLD